MSRGQGDLHGEVPGMLRAFTGQGRIDRAIVEKGHRTFLQTGLEILGLGLAHTDLVQKRPEDAGHDLLGRDIAAVLVHGCQHGLKDVAEHGVALAAALAFLAAAQEQQPVQAYLAGPVGKAARIDQGRAQSGQVPFSGVGKTPVQLPGDAQFKHSIAKESEQDKVVLELMVRF